MQNRQDIEASEAQMKKNIIARTTLLSSMDNETMC